MLTTTHLYRSPALLIEIVETSICHRGPLQNGYEDLRAEYFGTSKSAITDEFDAQKRTIWELKLGRGKKEGMNDLGQNDRRLALFISLSLTMTLERSSGD